ncbi:hypothetical protein HNR60_001970 [Rhodopseudomonas rhenobacensis]|uniref:DUF1468 domain-containing protein n=1 Tax=Rhodopseudomonas rhenobacensis TaxID=87461 RepID=A0A7W7Z3L6_9BRAD|nr:tripartite tricarboxylate transporter TctB family protein [Rhodopseudomonas rhenobacensis]MBB5047218.1 hypothetical protein [Rhodopseudomonas rhenobacensis]
MADTVGRLPEQTRRAARNGSGALAVLLLALAPQLVHVLWAAVSPLYRVPIGNPAQIAVDYATALGTALPAWLGATFGTVPSPPLPSAVLLALIYCYPLIALALLTLMVRPRGPQDYYGGIVLIAIAGLALWASSDLEGMQGFSVGAGTVPRLCGVLLMGLGAGIVAVGLFSEGPALARYAWRGPLFVSLAILGFALAIRPLGLVISAFASFMVAALGTPETRWRETTVVGIALTAGCSLLFPYALGLPLPLLPRFLLP